MGDEGRSPSRLARGLVPALTSRCRLKPADGERGGEASGTNIGPSNGVYATAIVVGSRRARVSESNDLLSNLEDRVLARMDRDGSLATFLQTFSGPAAHAALRVFDRFAGLDGAGLVGQLNEVRRLRREIAEGIALFAPLGWAPNERTNVEVNRAALNAYHSTGSLEEAECRLVEGWNQKDQLRFAVMPIQTLGVENDETISVGAARWRLVEKALAHHAAGAYEASVPIVLAQIDGLVKDLGFTLGIFEGGEKHDAKFADDATLFGLPESLVALRRLFGAHAGTTGMGVSLSRHGIMHGRELGYDTLANSTKAFVLLAAVVQWALPRSRALADAHAREQEARWAGNDELDEHGRRRDRRGFADAKIALQTLDARQAAEWRRHGRYRDDLTSVFGGEIGDRLLRGRDLLYLTANEDGTVYWAWRKTSTGFCFGSAAEGGGPVWHYAQTSAPRGGPGQDPAWRNTSLGPAHPEW